MSHPLLEVLLAVLCDGEGWMECGWDGSMGFQINKYTIFKINKYTKL